MLGPCHPYRAKKRDFRRPGGHQSECQIFTARTTDLLPGGGRNFFAGFPSGHYRHLNPRFLGTDLIGQGSYTFTPGLNFYKYIPPALLHANLWYTLSTDTTVAGKRTYYPDKVTLNLAMEYPIVRRRWIFLFEFVSSYDGGRLIGPQANQPPKP